MLQSDLYSILHSGAYTDDVNMIEWHSACREEQLARKRQTINGLTKRRLGFYDSDRSTEDCSKRRDSHAKYAPCPKYWEPVRLKWKYIYGHHLPTAVSRTPLAKKESKERKEKEKK
jgi:hypothetical protein